MILKKKDSLKITDNNIILNLSNELNDFCTEEILEKSRTKMRKDNEYSNELFEELPVTLKNRIIEFASSELIVTTASKYLGVFPILSRIYFYHNVKNPNNPNEQSAQRWHKDGMGHKGLDFFISITDINEFNGPLFLSKKNNVLGSFSKIENAIKNPKPGERNKISNEEFDKLHEEKDIESIIGKKGTCLIVDSYNCYHKGGFVKSGDRIMLRVAFDTIDSCVVNFDEEKYSNNNVFYYDKRCKKDVSNIFLKFLFFKRSKIMKFFKVPQKLLRFYQFFHYKIT